MSLLPCMSHCGPDSGSVSSSRVYNSVRRNALVPVLTLESRDRREPQIQNHGRLGELRDYSGDLAALRPDHAPSLEALSFEALGPAFLPGYGGQRTAHDLLPLRVQRRPPPRDTNTPLRRVPDTPTRRPEILPAPRSRLYAIRNCLYRPSHSGMSCGGWMYAFNHRAISSQSSAVSFAAGSESCPLTGRRASCTVLQHVRQRPWTVGHDHMDAEVEQASHLFCLVDGPCVHPDVASVGGLDESSGHEG